MRLFIGDDWAEDHHDVEVMDEAGKVLARRRLPAGMAGMAQLHALAGSLLGADCDLTNESYRVGRPADSVPGGRRRVST